jgi:hypothetical protein
MTLNKMRESGIRTVNRLCARCGSHGIVHVDGLPGDVTVVDLGKTMCCTTCGAPETETKPNWHEAQTGQTESAHAQPMV